MRDQQRSKTIALPQAFDQLVHLDARQGVKRAQRLVKQQQARVVHQRTSQRHALALPARQPRGPVVQAVGKADLGQHVGRRRLLTCRQAQRHVVNHPAPRQQARVLEHHADVAPQTFYLLRIERDEALRRRLQPGHQAEQRAFAAAAAANDGDELARRNVKLGFVQHLALPVLFGQAANLQPNAAGSSWFRNRHGFSLNADALITRMPAQPVAL